MITKPVSSSLAIVGICSLYVTWEGSDKRCTSSVRKRTVCTLLVPCLAGGLGLGSGYSPIRYAPTNGHPPLPGSCCSRRHLTLEAMVAPAYAPLAEHATIPAALFFTFSSLSAADCSRPEGCPHALQDLSRPTHTNTACTSTRDQHTKRYSGHAFDGWELILSVCSRRTSAYRSRRSSASWGVMLAVSMASSARFRCGMDVNFGLCPIGARGDRVESGSVRGRAPAAADCCRRRSSSAGLGLAYCPAVGGPGLPG